mmetsp:Transcript_11501/g.48244  ORF Transcript_11501/g.48244 Transcript_11501/m.48244 type:complete len:228 (-) Transcript_11501:585-1268(-)
MRGARPAPEARHTRSRHRWRSVAQWWHPGHWRGAARAARKRAPLHCLPIRAPRAATSAHKVRARARTRQPDVHQCLWRCPSRLCCLPRHPERRYELPQRGAGPSPRPAGPVTHCSRAHPSRRAQCRQSSRPTAAGSSTCPLQGRAAWPPPLPRGCQTCLLRRPCHHATPGPRPMSDPRRPPSQGCHQGLREAHPPAVRAQQSSDCAVAASWAAPFARRSRRRYHQPQ